MDLNPFNTSGHLQILLCLMPDDFTRQRETLGGERVKMQKRRNSQEVKKMKMVVYLTLTMDHSFLMHYKILLVLDNKGISGKQVNFHR